MERGFRSVAADSLEGLANVFTAHGNHAAAARLFACTESLREVLELQIRLDERAGHEEVLRTLRASLGEEAFHAAWAEGRGMPPEQAVALDASA